MAPDGEPIRKATAEVEAARLLLLSPSAEAVGRSAAHLERATAWLKGLEAADGSGAALSKLKQAVARVASLLESSAAFYLGWARQVATATCGYTPGGGPAMPGVPGTLSVEG